MNYRLIQYRDASHKPAMGIIVAGRCYALDGPPFRELLQSWETTTRDLATRAADIQSGKPVSRELNIDDLSLMAPVPEEATIYGAGANYRDHVDAMARALKMNLTLDPKSDGVPPWHFIKPGRATLTGHRARIAIPPRVQKLDWEAELAVIIGKRARNVTEAHALEHVAGYSCANDLSARDQFVRRQVDIASPFHFDWTGHKVFPGACPIGPALTPAVQVSSPESLAIKLWVNGSIRQDSSTSNHLFSIAEQIAFLSQRFELYPGDVILTGTPAGVGMESGTFISAGDVIRVEISGLGTLENIFA